MISYKIRMMNIDVIQKYVKRAIIIKIYQKYFKKSKNQIIPISILSMNLVL